MLFGGYNKSLFGTRKIEERTKDIPLEGDLVAAIYILTYEKTFATPDFSISLPAAYLVRWYNEGKVRFEDGRFVFADMPAPKGKAEKNYYALFTQAAGDDHVIWSREDVKKSFYFRFTKVPNIKELLEAQMDWFKKRGYIQKEGLIVPTLNDTGAKDARRLISLRNYLKDVKEGRDTLVPGDGNMAEYVVYSILFGIDDLFVESVRKVLPKELIEVYNAAIDLAEAGDDGHYEATD
ncbi:MAG: hypothetical protein J5907_05295 [Bacteroidales bacterium]|nr:hypothetical protein [Bacteroidales bacterium]